MIARFTTYFSTAETRIYQRVAVAFIFFCNGFAYGNWASRLPEVQKHFNVDYAGLGTALVCNSAGALIAMPFTGWITLRYGSRNITAIGAIIFSLSFVLIPAFQSIWSLRLIFLLIGAMNGVTDIAMNAQAVIVEKEYRRPIMSSFHAVFSGGMMIGAWVSSAFASGHTSLSLHFLTVALFNLFLLSYAIPRLVKSDSPVAGADRGPLFRLPNGALIAFGLIAFCCMLGEGSMADWTAIYINKSLGVSLGLAPFGVGAFSLAMVLGRSIGDRVIQRYGDRLVLITGSLISAAGLLFALSVSSFYIAIGGFFLVGLGLSTIVPICYSRAGSTPGIPTGVGLAMVTTVGYAGFLIGPPVIGYLADWFNLKTALYMVFLMFAASAYMAFRIRSTEKAA